MTAICIQTDHTGKSEAIDRSKNSLCRLIQGCHHSTAMAVLVFEEKNLFVLLGY